MGTRHHTSLLQPVGSILVCLDLTDIDPVLIAFASALCRPLQARDVLFLHIIQAYDLPDRNSRRFPRVETELKEIIHKAVHDSVSEGFRDANNWHIITRVGYEDAAQEIIDFIKGREIGLTIIGHKHGEDREAHYSHKIASEAASDILFVNQDGRITSEPVLCAIDFSDASLKAFERALDLSRATDARLVCYAVSDPARAYFPASTERSVSRDRQQTKDAFERLMKHYGLASNRVTCRVDEKDQASSEAENIYQAALEERAGLIILGAEGETGKVTSLLGHLSESFRIMEKEIPVMIVKHKSKTKLSGFWKNP